MLSRPRLRTKTGCLTCRRRRKKCTEERPRCRDCTRHGLDCLWPDVEARPKAAVAVQPHPAQTRPQPCTSTDPVLKSTPASASTLHKHRPVLPQRPLPPTSRALTTTSLASATLANISLTAPLPPSETHSNDAFSDYGWLPEQEAAYRSTLTQEAFVLAAASRAIAENDLLHHFVLGFMPLLVRSEAHPGFRDVSNLYSATSRRPWMRDIFYSLAALHLARGTIEHQAIADRYYHSALGAYWRVLASGEATGTEDWLLSAAVFFYLYEQWRSGVASNIMQHLEGTAQILRLRRLARHKSTPTTVGTCYQIELDIQRPSSPSPLTTPVAVDRIAAESFIYHVALVSIFYADLDGLASKFSWGDIDEGLVFNPYPTASDNANSPVLGLAPSIYRLAFEVTRLSRHAPLEKYDLLEVAHQRRALQRLKVACFDEELPLPTNMDSETETPPSLAPAPPSPTVHIYILVIELYLLKLLSDNTVSSDAYVQHLASAAMQLLRDEVAAIESRQDNRDSNINLTDFGPASYTSVPGYSFGTTTPSAAGSFTDRIPPAPSSSGNLFEDAPPDFSKVGDDSSTDLCWPMVILACAIQAPEDMQALKTGLITIWRTSYCGYVRRVALVIERVWTWRMTECEGGSGHDRIRDGLCLLTQKDGLVCFLNGAYDTGV